MILHFMLRHIMRLCCRLREIVSSVSPPIRPLVHCTAAASVLLTATLASAANPDPKKLIEKAMEQQRGLSSRSSVTMTIQRPDWRRSMTLDSWTAGNEQSLIRVTAPAKDAGNGTLLLDDNMWSYAPRINRVVKVPGSMMGQSWMGSDLSNKDISRSTDLIDQYQHKLLSTRQQDGHSLYVIESVPHEEAPVVWGKEVITLRDDYVLLEHQFWDQDGVLVKRFTTTDIREMDGRQVAATMRMQRLDKTDQWTEIQIHSVDFDLELPANLFTLSNLRNPRR